MGSEAEVYRGWMPFLKLVNSIKALKGKKTVALL